MSGGRPHDRACTGLVCKQISSEHGAELSTQLCKQCTTGQVDVTQPMPRSLFKSHSGPCNSLQSPGLRLTSVGTSNQWNSC